MLIKKLQHLATYYELYEFVADTKNTQAQIKMYLINEADVPESTARRNIKGFVEDEASMVTVDAEGVVTIKKDEIEELLKKFSELFEVNLPYQKEYVASDEKSKELVRQNLSLEFEKGMLLYENEELRLQVAELKMNTPIVLVDSVKVKGATEDELAAQKLSDSIPQRLREDKLLPNPVLFYDEVKGDKFLEFGKVSMGSLLTLDNYRKVVFRKLMNEKTIDKIDGLLWQLRQKFFANTITKEERAARKKKYLNDKDLRKRAVLEVMESDYPNHIKLSQYAMVADFDSSPNLYYLLKRAIEMDLDANYVISVLENRNIMANDFKAQQILELARAEGPYLQKVELAKELLLGEWTFVANYNGKELVFQLVPIDEFIDIRHQIEVIKERRRKEGEPVEETVLIK